MTEVDRSKYLKKCPHILRDVDYQFRCSFSAGTASTGAVSVTRAIRTDVTVATAAAAAAAAEQMTTYILRQITCALLWLRRRRVAPSVNRGRRQTTFYAGRNAIGRK